MYYVGRWVAMSGILVGRGVGLLLQGVVEFNAGGWRVWESGWAMAEWMALVYVDGGWLGGGDGREEHCDGRLGPKSAGLGSAGGADWW